LELEELMIKKYKKNRLENRENLVFYTNGSLVRTSAEKRGIDRMGASWIQVAGINCFNILNKDFQTSKENIALINEAKTKIKM
ncbi:38947_t:CDS:2, partial [Gigaspora margarita]